MDDLDKARRCATVMLENDNASSGLGISIDIPKPGTAQARLIVSEDMLNGFDVCHGGHIFALADSAFAYACNAYDQLTLAAGADIDFIRPAVEGDALLAVAVERSRGGRTGIYDVRVTNQDDEEIAVFRGRSYATRKSIISTDE